MEHKITVWPPLIICKLHSASAWSSQQQRSIGYQQVNWYDKCFRKASLQHCIGLFVSLTASMRDSWGGQPGWTPGLSDLKDQGVRGQLSTPSKRHGPETTEKRVSQPLNSEGMEPGTIGTTDEGATGARPAAKGPEDMKTREWGTSRV